MSLSPCRLTALLVFLFALTACGPTTELPPGEPPVDEPDVWNSGGEDVVDRPEPEVATLDISPENIVVVLNETLQLSATARTEDGEVFSGVEVSWSSSDETILRVSALGVAIGRGLGEVEVTARAENVSATVVARVVGKAVAEVEVVPKRRTLQIGERVELFVTLRDANRAVIDEERPVTWESNAPAVVAIGEDGFATGLAPGEAELVATVEGVSDTAEFTVEGIPVERVNIVSSTRRLIPEDEALFVAEVYDLENNLLEGRLITWSSSNEAIANVDEAGLVTAISAGTTMINATSEGKTAAVEVEVYFDFEDVATGGAHACGLIGGVAYCWGANEEGQLGRGTTSTSEPPARVVTQLRFVSLSLGAAHSCGLTRAGAAHCWGSGTDGRLGTGQTARETEPTPVSNGHVFSSLSAGESHTCGIDVTDKLWCWGNGADGRLGNGQAGSQNVPTEISGSLSIRSVSAGGSHTCAITTGSEGHCFGANDRGQLGTGNNTPHSSPTLIPGGYTFVVLKAGSSHTCGLAGSGLVTCFGANDRGQVGDTTNNDRSTPIFVSLPQGVSISGLSAGDDHTCGQAPGGVLYCWGAGTSGQLGDGQGEDAEAPVRVLSDQIFVAFDASGDQSCALNGDGKLYCWGLGASDLPLKVEF